MSWERVVLGGLISISKGKKHTPIENGVNRYINIENLHNASNSLFTNERGVFVDSNDLIIAWDGANAGKVGVGFSGVIGSTLARLKINNSNVYPKYLFWFLESKNELIKSQRTGATIPHINGQALKDLQIPLPPLDTQKRIAQILDAADALKRKDQELLQKYDQLAQAIFIDMFGDPVKNEKGWEKVSMNQVLEIRGRVGWKGYKKTDLRSSGPYVIGATHLTEGGDLDLTKSVHISMEKYIESPEIVVEKNDLLIVQRGSTIGKVGLVTTNIEEATINPCILIMRPFAINSYYLKQYFLQKKIQDILWRMNNGSAQPMLTQGDLRAFQISLPPIEVQNKFSDLCKKVKDGSLKNKKSIIQSDFLFQTLLQKAFKGELVS